MVVKGRKLEDIANEKTECTFNPVISTENVSILNSRLARQIQLELESLIDTPNSTYIISATKDRKPGTYEFANPFCLKNHGITLDEIKGLKYNNPRLHTKESYDAFSSAFTEAIASGNVVTYEYRDEKGNYFRKKIKKIDIDGERKALIVSENVTAEKEKENLQKELELRNRNLESIKLLSGGIAQDLNTQLTVMNGYTEYLESELGIGQRYEMQEIHKATHKAVSLVHELLEFSEKFYLEKQKMDLYELVERAFSSTDIGDKKIKKVNMIRKDEYPIIVTSNMHKVFSNLTKNSIESIPDQGMICVRATNYSVERNQMNLQKGEYANILFIDTGKGMTEEGIANCLEPNYSTKVGDPLTPQQGLGLTLAYFIVKNNGGDIRVSSETGKGTTMNIYLPLERAR